MILSSFDNLVWSRLIEILPDGLQLVAKALPLVHIFEEMRNILLNNSVNFFEIIKSILISLVYFVGGVTIFYMAYFGAKEKGTLINMGE